MAINYPSLTIDNSTKTSTYIIKSSDISKTLRINPLLLKAKKHKFGNYLMNGGILPLLDKQAFDIDDGMRQVKGTLAIEGLYLENSAENLIKAKVLGRISEKEFMRRALELAYE